MTRKGSECDKVETKLCWCEHRTERAFYSTDMVISANCIPLSRKDTMTESPIWKDDPTPCTSRPIVMCFCWTSLCRDGCNKLDVSQHWHIAELYLWRQNRPPRAKRPPRKRFSKDFDVLVTHEHSVTFGKRTSRGQRLDSPQLYRLIRSRSSHSVFGTRGACQILGDGTVKLTSVSHKRKRMCKEKLNRQARPSYR
jgi:hypothetical protein